MYERYLELLGETSKTTYVMCKDTGLRQSAISAWKSGKTRPSSRTFQVIADYFGVNVEWLSGETDVRENRKPANPEIGGLSATKYGQLNKENRTLIDAMIEKLYRSQS